MPPPSTLPTPALRRVENTVQQLLNDMRTVAESRCRIHGAAGGTTANSAAALLPLIGVEFVAQRTLSGESKDASIRRVFGEIAVVSGYPTYGRVGFAMFKLCRNGLAHGFYPNDVQLANGPHAFVMVSYWIDGHTLRSVCVEELSDRLESGHLTLRDTGDTRILNVVAQHLYLDVAQYLRDFLARLTSDRELQRLVDRNDELLLQQVRRSSAESLSSGDFIALGL